MTLSIVVAVSDNGVIGRDNALPWRLPEDLRRFKARTVGHTVIMGRKTAESILKELGGPLPNRSNVVLTMNRQWRHDGFEVVHSWEEAQQLVWEETIAFEGRGEIFVIGGASLYAQALSHAQHLYVTHVHCQCAGDRLFPNIRPILWKTVAQEVFVADARNEFNMTFATYDRILR